MVCKNSDIFPVLAGDFGKRLKNKGYEKYLLNSNMNMTDRRRVTGGMIIRR